MVQKVEFIESYRKIEGGDYLWNDNHGELIRCENCKRGVTWRNRIYCRLYRMGKSLKGYCDSAKRKETE